MADAATTGGLADWEILQKKIFTRWVNQRLQAAKLPLIKDVQTDLGQGNNLANLMFALSERELPKSKQPTKKPMIKAQQIEFVNTQLQFVWECGVESKLKPSAENLFNGDFKDVRSA